MAIQKTSVEETWNKLELSVTASTPIKYYNDDELPTIKMVARGYARGGLYIHLVIFLTDTGRSQDKEYRVNLIFDDTHFLLKNASNNHLSMRLDVERGATLELEHNTPLKPYTDAEDIPYQDLDAMMILLKQYLNAYIDKLIVEMDAMAAHLLLMTDFLSHISDANKPDTATTQ